MIYILDIKGDDMTLLYYSNEHDKISEYIKINYPKEYITISKNYNKYSYKMIKDTVYLYNNIFNTQYIDQIKLRKLVIEKDLK